MKNASCKKYFQTDLRVPMIYTHCSSVSSLISLVLPPYTAV